MKMTYEEACRHVWPKPETMNLGLEKVQQWLADRQKEAGWTLSELADESRRRTALSGGALPASTVGLPRALG